MLTDEIQTEPQAPPMPRAEGDRARGLYGKYLVTRTDGSSAPGGKHADCRYFVLDVDHDPLATPALQVYASAAAAAGYGQLADDLRRLVASAGAGLFPESAPADAGGDVPRAEGAPTAVSVAVRLRAAIGETGGALGVLLRDACRVVIEGAATAPAVAGGVGDAILAAIVEFESMPRMLSDDPNVDARSLAEHIAARLSGQARPALTPPAGEVEPRDHSWISRHYASRCPDSELASTVRRWAEEDGHSVAILRASDYHTLRALAAQAREAEGLRAEVAHWRGTVDPFIEWAQSPDVLDSGRWAGLSVFDGVRTELEEAWARVAELEGVHEAVLHQLEHGEASGGDAADLAWCARSLRGGLAPARAAETGGAE